MAGLRFDQAAAALFDDYSRARLQAWIRDGSLRLQGRSAAPKHRVAGGEWLSLDARPEPDETAQPEAIPLDILHADDDLLVVNKRTGLVVHPAAGNRDGTLLNGLLHYDPSLAELPRAGIVHRLDKETTGVMVVARSLRAHTRLVRALQARRIKRIYHAIACGHAPPEGTVDAPVGRDPRHRQRMAVVPNGRQAVSHFRRLHAFAHFSHLEVSLETGRTHQIRVHMQHLGLPLAGDPTYGPGRDQRRNWPEPVREAVDALGRQALHARTLELKHPASGETCTFEAPLPADMQALLKTLEREDP
ncbi:MAG: RluA family pseudouridine synthase [Xanthomonadales bacterium]|nr:RluA family pseudouridine synthase [Xanthomonadales bacterium]